MIVGAQPDNGARVDMGPIPVPIVITMRPHTALTIQSHYRCDFIDHHSKLRPKVMIQYGTFLLNRSGRTQRVAIWCNNFPET